MKAFRCLILVSSLLGTCATAIASLQPSFWAEGSSWRATDIVVVTEGSEIDGIVEVVETLKGDQVPGSILTIPELAEFKAADARLVDREGSNKSRWWSESVNGDRMILFLKDKTKTQAETEKGNVQNVAEDNDEVLSRWSGANPTGRSIRYSTVWIEHGKAYYFMPYLMYPGPILLSSTKESEVSLRKIINAVLSEQNDFNLVSAIPDRATRAECLDSFLQGSNRLATEAAFVSLTECGTAALPILGEELNCGQNVGIKGDVAEALAKAGDRAAGPGLTAFLAKEMQFWKQLAPTLKPGWWNGEGLISGRVDEYSALDQLRNRWDVLLHTLNALRAIRYEESAELVADLSDFWRSLPPMSGDGVSDACDEYFKALDSTSPGKRHLRPPAYKIHFEGNSNISSGELTSRMAEYVAQYDSLERDCDDCSDVGILGYATEQLCSYFLRLGFLDAKFTIIRGNSIEGQDIDFRVEEGKRYSVGDIKIEAGDLSANRVRAMLHARTGDVANGALFSKWVKDLEQSYHDLGYLKCHARLEHEARSSLAGENLSQSGLTVADFLLRVSQGPQFTVDALRFQGTSKVPEAQLSKAIPLQSGDKFNQARLDAGIKKINREFGLSLDLKRNVELETDETIGRVSIVNFLDRDRPQSDSIRRSLMKRKWYL